MGNIYGERINKYNIGKNNPNYKNGKYINTHGYIEIYLPNHPKNVKGYVKEHRYIYEQYYNCCLLPKTIIHHKNEIKTDNRIENLEAMSKKQHSVHHNKKQKQNN